MSTKQSLLSEAAVYRVYAKNYINSAEALEAKAKALDYPVGTVVIDKHGDAAVIRTVDEYNTYHDRWEGSAACLPCRWIRTDTLGSIVIGNIIKKVDLS